MVANKQRGEVSLPEAGEGAFLQFTVDSLERLESEFGEEYIDKCLDGLAKGRIKVYKTMISVSLNTKEPKEFPYGLSLEQIQEKLVDAMFLTLHGRTREEQNAYEDERYKTQMEQAKENPRLAAQLYSQIQNK